MSDRARAYLDSYMAEVLSVQQLPKDLNMMKAMEEAAELLSGMYRAIGDSKKARQPFCCARNGE